MKVRVATVIAVSVFLLGLLYAVVSGIALLHRPEGSEVDLNGGQGIEIAAGQTHEVRNKSAADVEFLVISCPPSRGDRVICDAAQ